MYGKDWGRRSLLRDKRIVTIAIMAALVTIGGIGFLMLQQKADQMLKELSPEIVEMLEDGNQASAASPDTNLDESLTEGAFEVGENSESVQVTDQRKSTTGKSTSSAQTSTGTTTKKPAVSADQSDAQEEAESASEAVSSDGLTLSEKSKAYTLATSKLSSAEIKNLMQWSKGGFTPEEKAQAKALFYSRFTAEEQRWILSLLSKYNS